MAVDLRLRPRGYWDRHILKIIIQNNTINVGKPINQQGTNMCTVTLRRSNLIIPHPFSSKESAGVPAVVSSSLLFQF